MNELMKVMSDRFEELGLDVQIVWIEARPHWTYETASRLVGHSDARVTMNLVAREAEFNDPAYTVTLTGTKFNEFRKLGSALIGSMSAKARRITLFTEAGLWLLVDKSDSGVGRDYRKLFCTQVAPQILRDGRYLPEREVTPQGVMVESEHARKMRELDIEEQKVQAQLRHLDMREREVKAQALVTLVDSLPYLSEDIRQAYRVKAAEELTGRDLAGLLPAAPAGPSWESPTAIAQRAGVHVNTVGKAITALGLRGAEGKSRKIVNKAKGHERTVETWLYSPEAAAEIERYLDET